jgi:HSP20 family protein
MDLIPRKFYLDDIFDDFMVPERSTLGKCDIYEKDNKYHIEMDVPGFKKEDLKINLENNYLTIKAEKKNEVKDDSKKYIRRERSYSKFERSIYLGDADEEHINAEYRDGILTIIVPKEDEKKSKKYIEIK